MNARYYVSGIGSFASADTIVPDPADPQSWNRYSYVTNNPINFNDPTGHCGADVGENADALTNKCEAKRFELMGILGYHVKGVWTLQQMNEFTSTARKVWSTDGIDTNNNSAVLNTFVDVRKANTSETSLEIAAKMLEFAYILGASTWEVIDVLSGHEGSGFQLFNENGDWEPNASRTGPHSIKNVLDDIPHGFNTKYGDPEPTNNQVHHTWYYVQLAYQYPGGELAWYANTYHEYYQKGVESRQSHEDHRAGLYGRSIGMKLRFNPFYSFKTLATDMREDLGP